MICATLVNTQTHRQLVTGCRAYTIFWPAELKTIHLIWNTWQLCNHCCCSVQKLEVYSNFHA